MPGVSRESLANKIRIFIFEQKVIPNCSKLDECIASYTKEYQAVMLYCLKAEISPEVLSFQTLDKDLPILGQTNL